MITIEQAMSNFHRTVTEAEIAAYLEGTAAPQTARRILARALREPAFRERLEALRSLDALEEEQAGADGRTETDESARARLTAFAQAEVRQIAGEQGRYRAAQEAASALRAALTQENKGGGFWSVAEEGLNALRDTLRSTGERILKVPSAALTLPGLAPAFASPEARPAYEMQRQTVLTEEGARIEFHLMPGTSERLRVLVDAAPIINLSTAPDTGTQAGMVGYNVAYLTLEDRVPDTSGTRSERHILAVPLNAQGRGLTDYALTSENHPDSSGEGIRAMPRSRSVYHLVDVCLARLNGDNHSDFSGEAASER